MWSFRKSLLLLGLCLISSCGFSPMYGRHSIEDAGQAQSKLSGIDIKHIDGRYGQALQTSLVHLLDAAISTPSDKTLEITLTQENRPLAIQQDRRITRFSAIMIANYKLFDKASGSVLSEGRVKHIASHAVVESDFATYIAEDDTIRRMMDEMARDIILRLSMIEEAK